MDKREGMLFSVAGALALAFLLFIALPVVAQDAVYPEPTDTPDPTPEESPEPAPSDTPDPSPEIAPSPPLAPEKRIQCCMCLTWAGNAEFTNYCKAGWKPEKDCDKAVMFQGINKGRTPPGTLPPGAYTWIDKSECTDVRAMFFTHGNPTHCRRYFDNVRGCWSVMKRNNCSGEVQMITTACSVFANMNALKENTKKIARECEDGFSCYVVAHATDGRLPSSPRGETFCPQDPDGSCSVPYITSWISKKEGEKCKARIIFPLCSDIIGDSCDRGDTIRCVNADGTTQIAACSGGTFYPRNVRCEDIIGKKCDRGGVRRSCKQGDTSRSVYCRQFFGDADGTWVYGSR